MNEIISRADSQCEQHFMDDHARWRAVKARDPSADGHFVYAVKTTGVYCQPSSRAKLPKRDNVEFFDDAQAAERAGYRPSRRPSDQDAAARRVALVAQACRLIEQAETLPGLDELAARAQISPSYFHRLFKAETGLTPKAYASAHRANRLRRELAVSPTITDAIYGAGFNSNSRFYGSGESLLGMRARDWRDGGVNVRIRFAVAQCSLGAILVAQSQYGICAILLGDDPDQLLRQMQDQFPKAHLTGGDAKFERMVAKVIGYIEAPGLGLNLPLDVRGTAFQRRVWQALQAIPPGSTVSYAELANRIGAPSAARAVGHACATNLIAVAIPCHRVVRHDGSLSGYRWGVERKRELLQREKAAAQDGQ